MKHDIFISYKSEDYETANLVKTVFETNQFTCWMAPQSIPGGSSYAEEINGALYECGVFVLILSERAQESKYIKKEIDLALGFNKPIMPLLIENCNISGAFNFYLTDVQRYDAYLNMSLALKKMIKEINERLGRKISYVPNFSNLAAGETVEFGSYIQNDSICAKTELLWKVIDKTSDAVLLLCEKCIELRPLNYEKDANTTWGTCTLRRWLNSAFLSTAFDDEEKQCIILSKIINEANSEHYTTAGNDTEDKVFILSISEAEKYFASNDERIAFPTEQVLLQTGNETDKGINWWLRTPGYYHYRAAIVSSDGRIDYDGYSASRGNLAVRPAIWVKNI